MKKHLGKGKLAFLVLSGVVAVLLSGAIQIAKSAPVPQKSDTPKILTTSLPDGKVGTFYFAVMRVVGGEIPWDFSAKGQPKGLTFMTPLGDTSDSLNGKPTQAGDFNVTVTVTDSATPPHSSSKTLKLHIAP